MRGVTRHLRVAIFCIALGAVLAVVPVVVSLRSQPWADVLNDRVPLILLGVIFIVHAGCLKISLLLRDVKNPAAFISYLPRSFFLLGTSSLLLPLSQNIAGVLALLGITYLGLGYRNWYLDRSMSQLGKLGRRRWAARRPTMWLPEFVMFVVHRQLSKARASNEGKSTAEKIRNDLEFQKKVNQRSALVILVVCRPITIGIVLLALSHKLLPGPQALGAFVLFVFAAISLASAGYMNQASQAISELINSIDKSVDHKERLDSCVRERIPFCLYLRDFASEGSQFESRPTRVIVSLRLPPITMPPSYARSKLEKNILQNIIPHLPVFYFTNYYDFVIHSEIKAIRAETNIWHEMFTQYVIRAHLAVFLVEGLGRGLESEMDWIGQNRTSEQILLVARRDSLKNIQERHAEFSRSVTWTIGLDDQADGDFHLPEDLIQYVAAAQPRKQTI